MSQDIEIDPDSRTIKYYDNRTEQSIREHVDSGGRVLSCEQVRVLLNEIDRLRKENTSLNQSAKSLAYVNHQLQKELFDQNQVMNELFQKAERLEKLVPPETERGPGFVGQGSWSVYAEKVVAERDAAQERVKQHLEEKIELRDELGGLCEDIRVLKEAFDDFKEESAARIQELLKENSELHRVNAGLQEEVTRCGTALASKKEHANIHLGGKGELHGIDGYGPFNLKQVDKDRWEIWMLHEKVTLYNKKGHRVRGDHNYEGDW
jgi:DNA repair exonuclease SbcCD ATPase subunit